jgi:RNA polymerase sigma-70 factor (ECF subfamily)
VTSAPRPLTEELLAQRPTVLRFLRRVLGNDAEAADLTQETMLAALQHVDTWRGEGTGRAWLLAIARNQVRASRRAVREDVGEEPTLEALGADAGWGAPVDPEVLSAQLEERLVLERALEALPAEAREILTLRELEGFSGEETAQALGVSLAAMKSRLHRARLELVAAVKRQLAPRVRAEVHHG